ncbi:MAG TPA: hypothetical protein DG577_07015 [Firmicutes bacterium]|nr:hypothetical protein [Bacillota bacterium]HBS92716.1 hypothetical protein [Bacillota bacterium]HCX79145.1 hypothetical protein [Bacillota bacterium]
MGTITAQILVGSGHPYHDGIAPSHRLYLSENSRPSWILVPENWGGGSGGNKVTWIPTLENSLEDALLMIGIHVVKDPELVELASQYISSKENNWVVVYEDADPENLSLLYQRCRALENTFKLVITVMRGSLIEAKLKVLEDYKMDVEVCRPQFVRLFSQWLDQTRIEGEL